MLRRLNEGSLADPRVRVHVGDAFALVAELPFTGRCVDAAELERLFDLPRDPRPEAGEAVLPNRLGRPVLADYQRQGRWHQSWP